MFLLISAFLVLAFASPSFGYTPSAVSVWSTVPSDPSIRFSPQAPLTFSPDTCQANPLVPVVSVSSTRLQPLVGFGASLTESAAYNFAALKARNSSAYQELLTRLFAPAPAGIGISFMRLPITSCDFIQPTGLVPWWTFDDTPNDTNFAGFNASRAQLYQIPVLQDIWALVQATGGQMRLVGTPWSAPIGIKDSNSWYGGNLLDSQYAWYASYLTRVASTFKALGTPLYALSLQNEPLPVYEWSDYPSTALTPQNESALASLLKPALKAAGLDTLVMAFDADAQFASYPIQVLQGVGGDGQTVDAVGFHGYGPVPNQSAFHSAYPNTVMLFTEYSSFDFEYSTADFQAHFLDEQNKVYFQNLNNWGSSGQHWSLSVDLQYGPHQGGCTDCSGTVTVDAANLTRPYVVDYTSQYYSIGHWSALIPPMSYRLASTQTAGAWVQSLAAVTPDGSVVVQLLNTNSAPVQVLVRDTQAGASGSCYLATLQPNSMSSFKYGTSGGGGGGGGLSNGAVAAIVVVVVVAVLAAAIGGWWALRRRASSEGGVGGRQWQSQRDQSGGSEGMEMALN